MWEEHARHILPKCPQKKEWREELVCSKWLNINEVMAYRKIIVCKNVTALETIRNYLYKN
jgi:hypothetical protein